MEPEQTPPPMADANEEQRLLYAEFQQSKREILKRQINMDKIPRNVRAVGMTSLGNKEKNMIKLRYGLPPVDIDVHRAEIMHDHLNKYLSSSLSPHKASFEARFPTEQGLPLIVKNIANYLISRISAVAKARPENFLVGAYRINGETRYETRAMMAVGFNFGRSEVFRYDTGYSTTATGPVICRNCMRDGQMTIFTNYKGISQLDSNSRELINLKTLREQTEPMIIVSGKTRSDFYYDRASGRKCPVVKNPNVLRYSVFFEVVMDESITAKSINILMGQIQGISPNGIDLNELTPQRRKKRKKKTAKREEAKDEGQQPGESH